LITSADPHVPGEEIVMASPAENIAKLKDAYRRWDHSEGRSTVFETPNADLVTFRDGRIVDFYEFYDTKRVLSATQG
jgi:ketosteroid isomerase-like protein